MVMNMFYCVLPCEQGKSVLFQQKMFRINVVHVVWCHHLTIEGTVSLSNFETSYLSFFYD